MALKKILVCLAIFALLAGCAQMQLPPHDANSGQQKIAFTLKFPGSGVPVVEQRLETQSGTTLFDAMHENGVSMKYREYSFGKMITSIGLIGPSAGGYLSIYANGKYSEKGASELVPRNGDTIEFRIEKIE